MATSIFDPLTGQGDMDDALVLLRLFRSLPMTPREREILHRLEAEPEEELTWAKGGGWWLGLERVGAPVARRLLQKVYISMCYHSNAHDYICYAINSDGVAALREEDP